MEHSQGDSIARDFSDDVNGKAYVGDDAEDTLARIKTSGTGSVTISSELFEKLYLQPKISGPGLKHPLQKILGNPTPLAIIGFEMSLMPITMQLMEWRGAEGSRTANNANVIFYGGVLMWIAGLFEFLLGNTFPFLVFTAFGSFYASYGATLIPWFATYASFSEDPYGASLDGLSNAGFNASYGHYWAAFTILMFFFFLCSLRTNVVFVIIFATIFPAVACLTAVFYYAADGEMDKAHDCQVAAGGILFSTCIVGWYLFAGLIFPSVDFPIPIPLGDLQQVVPALSDLSGGRKSGRSIFRKRKHDTVEDSV
ncbi:Putative acetate transporter GPR1/FUN34/SatP family [Septoria linicola]|uniref:Acetate transporter GPR1/FUN34/SatP family n=1 Tax=Septoria linicola TaxID=215465 RepID=A0A9Q9B445_9PEZI|nr:putative acetate transporter GPR1/FUN34/SatP family [Septoria linicola]USW55976.1 Putative acetate transporter GPR1/FUN34/SatP family [Septoria linicola]